LLGRVYDDKDVQEWIVRRSKLDWVIARPVILTDGPKTDAYRALVDPCDWTCGFICAPTSRISLSSRLMTMPFCIRHRCSLAPFLLRGVSRRGRNTAEQRDEIHPPNGMGLIRYPIAIRLRCSRREAISMRYVTSANTAHAPWNSTSASRTRRLGSHPFPPTNCPQINEQKPANASKTIQSTIGVYTLQPQIENYRAKAKKSAHITVVARGYLRVDRVDNWRPAWPAQAAPGQVPSIALPHSWA